MEEIIIHNPILKSKLPRLNVNRQNDKVLLGTVCPIFQIKTSFRTRNYFSKIIYWPFRILWYVKAKKVNRIAQTREMNPHTKVVIGHIYQSSFETALISSDAFSKTQIMHKVTFDLILGLPGLGILIEPSIRVRRRADEYPRCR